MTPFSRSGRAGRDRLRGIYGLRAIACLTVLLANFHHSLGMAVSGRAGPLDFAYFAESGIGVVLLIVLSGALLSLPYWHRLNAGVPDPSWRHFAIRRAVRLVPAYYVCLLAFMIVSPPARRPFDAAAHLLFVNNLFARTFYSVSPQFWTIGMFVQFYVTLPVLFVLLRRVGPRLAPPVVALLASLAYLLHVVIMATYHRWTVGLLAGWAASDGLALSHSTLAHFPQFLIGVVVGWGLSRLAGGAGPVRRHVRLWCELLFWAAAAGLVFVSAMPSLEHLALPYGRYVFPWTAAFAGLAIVTLPFTRAAAGLLSMAPLRALGTVSYGVYVYQMACLIGLERLGFVDGHASPIAKAEFFAAGFALTVLVATGSYLFIERPLLRWQARAGSERVSRGAAPVQPLA